MHDTFLKLKDLLGKPNGLPVSRVAFDHPGLLVGAGFVRLFADEAKASAFFALATDLEPTLPLATAALLAENEEELTLVVKDFMKAAKTHVPDDVVAQLTQVLAPLSHALETKEDLEALVHHVMAQVAGPSDGDVNMLPHMLEQAAAAQLALQDEHTYLKENGALAAAITLEDYTAWRQVTWNAQGDVLLQNPMPSLPDRLLFGPDGRPEDEDKCDAAYDAATECLTQLSAGRTLSGTEGAQTGSQAALVWALERMELQSSSAIETAARRLKMLDLLGAIGGVATDASRFLKLASLCLKQERVDLAEAAALSALSTDEKNADAWLMLGVARARAQNFEGAALAFTELTQIEPNAVSAWADLGEAYLALSRYEEAALAFHEVMTRDPDALHPAGRRTRAVVAQAILQAKENRAA